MGRSAGVSTLDVATRTTLAFPARRAVAADGTRMTVTDPDGGRPGRCGEVCGQQVGAGSLPHRVDRPDGGTPDPRPDEGQVLIRVNRQP